MHSSIRRTVTAESIIKRLLSTQDDVVEVDAREVAERISEMLKRQAELPKDSVVGAVGGSFASGDTVNLSFQVGEIEFEVTIKAEDDDFFLFDD